MIMIMTLLMMKLIYWMVGFFEKTHDYKDEDVDDNDDDVQPVGWSVSLRRWGRCRPPGAGVARPRLRKYFPQMMLR